MILIPFVFAERSVRWEELPLTGAGTEGMGGGAPSDDVAAQVPLDGKLLDRDDPTKKNANRFLEVIHLFVYVNFRKYAAIRIIALYLVPRSERNTLSACNEFVPEQTSLGKTVG